MPRTDRSSPRQVRLGTILALLVLVTTVPLGLFAAHLIHSAWQQQQELVNAQNIERARAISVAVDQEVRSTISALQVLASPDTLNPPQLATFYSLARNVVTIVPGWHAVLLVDPPSRVLLNTDRPLEQPAELLSDDWVTAARTTGRPSVSRANRDPLTGLYVVSIGIPVVRDGQVKYVLGARVRTTAFSQVLQQQKTPADGVVALMDSSLTIIARSRAEEKYVGGRPTDQFAESIRSAREGAVRSRMLEGTASYSAHSTSPLTGWTIGLGVPASSVDRPLLRSFGLLVSVMATLLVSGLVLAFLVHRRIVRAQTAAVASARALARGEPVRARRSTVAEFNDLTDGLQDAAAILERRLQERDEAEAKRARAAEDLERALLSEQAARAAGERNEARLSVTLRSIGDAVIATDSAGLVTMVNRVAQSLTGWKESEAVGQHIDAVFETVDEYTRRPKPSPVARVMTGESAPVSSQAVLMARDGRDIPIGDSAAPILGPDGALLGIVVVFRDMTAERDAERQRAAALEREQAARRAAESLSRAKDEFVATVSHELRTPLNAIFGWVAMLKMGSLDAEGQRKALDVIDRNTRVQAQLIEDLLDMARVIRGTVRLDMRPTDLAIAVESALDSVKPAADARRVAISAHVPRGIAIVSGDPSRLQQVVWNMLSNAIKFSQVGDEVGVRLHTVGDDAVLEVSDTGIGIDPAFLPHVFDRFRQETSDVTREHAGLGLGLSLVRHLVELHGGTVAAKSGGKAQGALFTVRLPLIGARAGRDMGLEAAEPATLPEVRPDALSGLLVLVVDDDADARELIATVLGQAGGRIEAAASVREAFAVLESVTPDIIVTDIAMPQATGFDLVKRLRADPRWSAVPVVAVTAYARAEDRAEALALGFHAHIGKPFSPRALVAVVAEFAER
jgi:PAS domain S-box-containing protein